MWSLVSELHSRLAFDNCAYSEENLARFERVDVTFRAMQRGGGTGASPTAAGPRPITATSHWRRQALHTTG